MPLFSRRRYVLFAADNGVSVVMYKPIAARVQDDPRLFVRHAMHLKVSRQIQLDERNNPGLFFGRLGIRDRIMHHKWARKLPWDVFITPSFSDKVHARFARKKIQTFHGVSFKNYCIKDKALRYDALFLPGPYHRRRYIESGLFHEDDPRLRLVGLPKLDPLVDGSLDRDAILADLHLDPARPTILYAPTGDIGNSLNRRGQEIIDTVRKLPVNLIIKPHDHASQDPDCEIDWLERLRHFEAEHCVAVFHPDIVPLMWASDLLITDASSVAFEYTLLDRPIVFMECPELFASERARQFDLKTWGRRGGDICDATEDLLELIPRLLDDASEKSEIRRAIAADLFHEPGRAADNAALALYDELDLEPPPSLTRPPSPKRASSPPAVV